MLSNNEKEFLKSLSVDPRWGSILKKLERKPPTYRPGDDTEDKLVHKFIYESGRYQHSKDILTILGASHD